MTSENFDTMLRQMLHRRPFQMFTVHLNSGERFQVDHRDAVAFQSGIAVFIGPGKKLHWFDHNSVQQFVEDPVESDA